MHEGSLCSASMHLTNLAALGPVARQQSRFPALSPRQFSTEILILNRSKSPAERVDSPRFGGPCGWRSAASWIDLGDIGTSPTNFKAPKSIAPDSISPLSGSPVNVNDVKDVLAIGALSSSLYTKWDDSQGSCCRLIGCLNASIKNGKASAGVKPANPAHPDCYAFMGVLEPIVLHANKTSPV